MARDGSGTYTRVANTFSNPAAQTVISPADAEAYFDDVETELTDSLSRSGKGGMSATAVLKLADGTSAAPALTFTTDTDTGIARTTANTMVVAASGVAQITVTPSAITFGSPITFPTTTITGLTNKGSPNTTDDYVIIYDAAGTAVKKATVGSIGAAGSVASFNARTGAVVPAAGDYVHSNNTAPLPAKYWSGLGNSNNTGTPNTKIDIAAGSARDSTDAFNIVVSATKTIDLSVNGAVDRLDAGTLAADTKYYTFVIAKADGTAGSLASLSASAPTLPATYVYFRRVGFFKTATGAATVLPFKHVGDTWYWETPVRGIGTSSADTTAVLQTMECQPHVSGIKVFGSATTSHATLVSGVWIYPEFVPSSARDGYLTIWPTAGGGTWVINNLPTNSSGQIYRRASQSNTTITFDVAGWVDPL